MSRPREAASSRPCSRLNTPAVQAAAYSPIPYPIATAGWLVQKTSISAATVNKSLGHLERLDIVRELTAQKRNRLFSYSGYVKIMGKGTELPGN